MKKISQLILTILFISFILPSLAFASWWNPISWFGDNHPNSIIISSSTSAFSSTTATTTKITTSYYWWNPISWFNKSEKTETLQVATSTVQVSATTTPISTTKSIKTKPDNQTEKQTIEKTPDSNVTTTVSSEELNRICIDVYGINSMWNGITQGTGKKICDCKVGYQLGEGQMQCIPIIQVNTPPVVIPTTQTVDLYAKYRDQNGKIMTPEEFVKNADAKCASQGKVRATTINSDGTVNCISIVIKTNDQLCQDDFGTNSIWNGKLNSNGGLSCGCRPNYQFNSEKTGCVEATVKTPVQICQERYGVHATVSNTKDANGNGLCECEDGYVTNSSKTTCQIQQQNSCDDGNPYGVFNDGVVYSPEQKDQIRCSYCGGVWCNNSAPIQINNYYQVSQPSPQTQTINCANYQIEKNNLDQSSANSGTLFSGARVNAENALKARYPGCY